MLQSGSKQTSKIEMVNKARYSNLELASLITSALIILCAALIIATYLIEPITWGSITLGRITAIVGLLLFIATFFFLLQIPFIGILLIKKSAYRFQVVASFLGSLSCCIASLLVTGYLTEIALGRPQGSYIALWFALAVMLISTYYALRHTPN
jgi:hypothetical protein